MPSSAYHLSEIINTRPTEDNRCIGWARSKGRKCQNFIHAASRREAGLLLEQATKQLYAGQRIDDTILEDIAFLLLCKRWHRDQASGISAKWQGQVQRFLVVRAPPAGDRCWHKREDVVPALGSCFSSSFVVDEVSRRNVEERSFKVTNLSGAGYQRSPREQPTWSLSQPHNDTHLSIQTNPLYHPPSSNPSTEEIDPDSEAEMFTRAHRPRRVQMPSRINRLKDQPDVSKPESRATGILEAKASSSSIPRPKIHRAPTAVLRFEDRSRAIDEYMHKLRRMEPGEDLIDLEERMDSQEMVQVQKASLFRELKAIVPSRCGASGPGTVDPVRSGDRSASQTMSSRGVAVGEERKHVIDKYMGDVRRMEPGRDETDDQEEEGINTEATTALMARIARIAENVKRADDGKRTAKASRRFQTPKGIAVQIEESPLGPGAPGIMDAAPIEDAANASNKTPKDINIPVDISIAKDKPPTQTYPPQPPKITTTIQPTKHKDKDAKTEPIITEVRELEELEDLASASTHSSHSNLSACSSSSSISSLGPRSRSSTLPSMTTQQPDIHTHIHDKNLPTTITTPSSSMQALIPSYDPPPSFSQDPKNTQLILKPPTPQSNNSSPSPQTQHPILTPTLATALALFEGLRRLVNTVQLVIDLLRDWALFDRQRVSVVIWFGLYLWVMGKMGMV